MTKQTKPKQAPTPTQSRFQVLSSALQSTINNIIKTDTTIVQCGTSKAEQVKFLFTGVTMAKAPAILEGLLCRYREIFTTKNFKNTQDYIDYMKKNKDAKADQYGLDKFKAITVSLKRSKKWACSVNSKKGIITVKKYVKPETTPKKKGSDSIKKPSKTEQNAEAIQTVAKNVGNDLGEQLQLVNALIHKLGLTPQQAIEGIAEALPVIEKEAVRTALHATK